MGGDNSMLWSMATIGGPVVLVVVIAFALLKRRKLSPAEKQAQRQGIERNYRETGE